MDQNVANYYNTIQDNIRKSIKDNLEKAKALPVGTVRNWGGKLYKKDNTNNWNFIGYANESKNENKFEGYEGRPEKLKEVEDKIKQQKFESLYVISDDGKELVNRKGDSRSVHIPENDQKKFDGAIVTHNHPGYLNHPEKYKNSNSFSKADVLLACKNNAKEMRAVGSDGYIYSIKPGEFEEWGNKGGFEMIKSHFNQAKQKVRMKYEQKIFNKAQKYGEDSKEAEEAVIEAQSNDAHHTMKIVADNLKLDYKVYKNN